MLPVFAHRRGKVSTASPNYTTPNALRLVPGSSQRVDFPDAPALNATSATVMIWCKINTNAGTRAIISKGNLTVDGCFGVLRSGTNAFTVYVAANATDGGVNFGVTPNGVCPTGTWVLVAFAVDAAGVGNANRLLVWVNGVQQSLTFTGTIAAGLRDDATPLRIGAWQVSGTVQWYDDADVGPAIYVPSVLTTAQVLAFYNKTNPANTSPAYTPSAWWKFLEGTGSSIGDSAGTNTGTIVNSPAWVAGAP